ncbi:uncharacterized protein [Lepeophtheirus salmonis]|uniref:uncharacterized protein n=1 Tax=Lepeophtheirus salmonis TaxID=72036 RepID=UPI001AE1F181|nr:rhoGEF domain-containing protein gxcI-like [Lepeophtheirus salmonis]
MKKTNTHRGNKQIPDPSSTTISRHSHSSILNGFIPTNNISNSSSCSPPVVNNNNNNCETKFKAEPDSNRIYYWRSLSSANTTTAATAETLGRPIYDDTTPANLPPPPNFRLNFVKKMEDSLILRLPQGSCDTTPDTPDSLDDDSVDQSSLPPTPLPIPVSDLPLPNPPSQHQQHLMHSRHRFQSTNSPDPWFMQENLIEEISAPPNAVCSSASSPATPIGSPLAQQRTMLRSISQVRLNNSNNNNHHHPNSSIIHFNNPHSTAPPLSNGKPPRTYSSLYPQMIHQTSSNIKTGARHDANNNNEFEDPNETQPFKSQTLLTTTTTTTTKVIKSSTTNGDQINSNTIKARKKQPPAPPSTASRYATIGTRVKRSTMINNNNRIINANLSSATLHCTKSNRDPLPLKPPPYQDPPKYRKPKTTISMENNPANSSSSCFTIDSAMNSINNTNNNNRPCDPLEKNLIPKDVVETQNAILKDLQRHMSYELLENPRHVTSEEDEEEENHIEADVRVTTSLLQIKSKSLPTIARMQQQNQLTNGHCYKLGSSKENGPEESGEDPIQERLRNDSLSTLNEVNSSKIANLSSASSSMIDKLRTDTNRDHLEVQKKPIDLDCGGEGGQIKPGRNRVDSIVDRDIIEDKDEKKRKLHNGTLKSKDPDSSQISTTDDDFETTDEDNHRSHHHHHHRKYRRKRSSLSHPDSIEETEDDDELDDDDDDFNGETESPEMEICDPCQCYGKCCLDMVASFFCVSLL